MLLISRKCGEWIILTLPNGDTIRVSVKNRTHGGGFCIVLDAPKDVRIERMENNREDKPPPDPDRTHPHSRPA